MACVVRNSWISQGLSHFWTIGACNKIRVFVNFSSVFYTEIFGIAAQDINVNEKTTTSKKCKKFYFLTAARSRPLIKTCHVTVTYAASGSDWTNQMRQGDFASKLGSVLLQATSPTHRMQCYITFLLSSFRFASCSWVVLHSPLKPSH